MTKIVTLARQFLGTQERTGNNDNIFNDWYYGRKVSGKDYAWCVVFIAYLFDLMGVKFCDVKTASCTYVMNYAKRCGKWVTKDFKEGDLLIFDWEGDGVANHIGIYVDESAAGVHTIEGNTSGTGKYDGVYEKTRKRSQIMGAYRPDYPMERACHEWADVACQWAIENGIFQGKGMGYDWYSNITREEAAVVLYRLAKYVLAEK